MPALKSTLRFLALGACADMATAFGTIGKVGEYIDVETESSSNQAPDCPCDSPAYWYCKLSAYPSLGKPIWPSFTLAVMTQSVNFCYNLCYKTSSYLEATRWTEEDGRGCAACQALAFDDKGIAGYKPANYGCECKPQADKYDECNSKNGVGDSSADIWYKEICSPYYQPGGQLATALGMPYRDILSSATVTDTNGKTEAVPYNPFLHEATFAEDFKQDTGGGSILCLPRGEVSGDVDPSEACAGVLAKGSEDVGDYTGCDDPVESVESSDQCGKMYYYQDTWLFYCKSGSNYTGLYDNFKGFCKGFSEADCGTITDPKYYVKNPWGNYNICAWKNGKCKMHWPGSATPPTVKPAICEPSLADVDAGKSSFRVDGSICKQELCGGGGEAGKDKYNKACFL